MRLAVPLGTMYAGVVIGASALVLAGGRSSRMGSPKALLRFGGEPLLVHSVTLLRQLFSDVVVASSPGQRLPRVAAVVVEDEVPYQGPLGGLCYGLGMSRGDVVFVTSCDSPFLNLELISYLLSRIAGFDIVVPQWQGRDQTVHAVYRRSVLPVVKEQLARGELKAGSLLDRVRTRRIDEDDIRRFDADGASFFSMNTPEDYAAALARWRASGS